MNDDAVGQGGDQSEDWEEEAIERSSEIRRPKPQAGVHNAAGAIDHTAAVNISSTKSTFQ